ncbi:Ribonuclease [Rasamsonia emersonii CBS 393.64]|uniref:Ribonuclease n=1 Tax=Rasamsonia emersonii (strain ATCC 16479 / CBS 393.64 / IMI 116815) TaxID=1408163 RepID=A0A0F4YFT2_RASE3|nr:Ribonuclease [Rasamsonia emersonii CBS 393.64]KKA16791.1 Ribonuclease [Rasamsonia emersonii CBS 393.64]
MEEDILQESPETPDQTPGDVFIPPSIDPPRLLSGDSYTHYSPCPSTLKLASTSTSLSDEAADSTPCVLGVDEAGRGPVLGPMVYSAFYLPKDLEHSLLTRDHSFNDSKALTPGVRSNLMRLLCTSDHPLHNSCGWAVKVLSARDISSGMMRPGVGAYNLNAQAMDATIEIIRGIIEERHVDVREVYIDTVGNPASYQQKLERIFPSLKITVAKKADALYPCVSAASVVAKVTRDAALDVCYEALQRDRQEASQETQTPADGWGSGYPSDSKCVGWLRREMHSIFGWGNECRFSWGTAKEMLEGKEATKVEWPADDDDTTRLTDFVLSHGSNETGKNDELCNWYGNKFGEMYDNE